MTLIFQNNFNKYSKNLSTVGFNKLEALQVSPSIAKDAHEFFNIA